MLIWHGIVTASILGASVLMTGPVRADEPAPAAATITQVPATPKPAPVKTGKERLSSKASDEQRVDNCKVPPRLRGATVRPDTCERKMQAIPTN